MPLTEAGRNDAGLLKRRLQGESFGVVLTSPLSRASETCRLAGFADVARTSEELLEWDYGDYEGRTTAEIRSDAPWWSIWHAGAVGGESPQDVGDRVDRVIAELREVSDLSLVFAHGHVLRVMAARWLGLAASEGRLFRLDTTTVSVLGYERETPVILCWNEDCHLRSGS